MFAELFKIQFTLGNTCRVKRDRYCDIDEKCDGRSAEVNFQELAYYNFLSALQISKNQMAYYAEIEGQKIRFS